MLAGLRIALLTSRHSKHVAQHRAVTPRVGDPALPVARRVLARPERQHPRHRFERAPATSAWRSALGKLDRFEHVRKRRFERTVIPLAWRMAPPRSECHECVLVWPPRFKT